MGGRAVDIEYAIEYAEKVIQNTYGDSVSVAKKAKSLFKFGLRDDLGTSEATIMTLPSGQLHEAYVSDNTIAYISSSDDNDTEEVTYEYHTIDGNGDFTFGVGTVTLQGQTKVALPTPAARVSRSYISGSTPLAGTVYIYEDDTVSAVQVTAGFNGYLASINT